MNVIDSNKLEHDPTEKNRHPFFRIMLSAGRARQGSHLLLRIPTEDDDFETNSTQNIDMINFAIFAGWRPHVSKFSCKEITRYGIAHDAPTEA